MQFVFGSDAGLNTGDFFPVRYVYYSQFMEASLLIDLISTSNELLKFPNVSRIVLLEILLNYTYIQIIRLFRLISAGNITEFLPSG